jgi:exodeoxyribonuclease-3
VAVSGPGGKAESGATFSVTTVNVNGIRAAERRGGLQWLADASSDVILLQEVRATHEQLHAALSGSPLVGYHVAHAPAPQLGRAGVAILSRLPVRQAERPTGDPLLDGQGRWVEAEVDTALGPILVASVYVHTGEADTGRQVEKFAFLESMNTRLQALRARARRRGAHVLVGGDFNIAHHEVDIKNWRANRGKAGFMEQERAYLDRWFARDWVDLGRRLGGDGPGPYTWWSWRGRGFDTDGGWRIDYLIATGALGGAAAGAEVGKAPTYAERWSDHAPLTVTFTC